MKSGESGDREAQERLGTKRGLGEGHLRWMEGAELGSRDPGGAGPQLETSRSLRLGLEREGLGQCHWGTRSTASGWVWGTGHLAPESPETSPQSTRDVEGVLWVDGEWGQRMPLSARMLWGPI